jgi:hypothetical protein
MVFSLGRVDAPQDLRPSQPQPMVLCVVVILVMGDFEFEHLLNAWWRLRNGPMAIYQDKPESLGISSSFILVLVAFLISRRPQR